MTEMKHSIMKNPLMILLLGATPALAATTDVRSALGMGGAVLVILVLSNIITFLLKGKIAHETKLATNVLIVTGVVSVVQMLMAAFLPSIYNITFTTCTIQNHSTHKETGKCNAFLTRKDAF